jgi:hypothetical protein
LTFIIEDVVFVIEGGQLMPILTPDEQAVVVMVKLLQARISDGNEAEKELRKLQNSGLPDGCEHPSEHQTKTEDQKTGWGEETCGLCLRRRPYAIDPKNEQY